MSVIDNLTNCESLTLKEALHQPCLLHPTAATDNTVNISFCKSSLGYTILCRTFTSLNYACIRSYSKSLLYQFVYGWEPTTLYKSVCSKQASSVARQIIYLWRTWTIQLRSSASLLCVCVCVWEATVSSNVHSLTCPSSISSADHGITHPQRFL